MKPDRSNRRIRLMFALGCSVIASAAMAQKPVDPSRLKPVRLAPKQERAAPPPPVKAYAIDGKHFYYGGREFIVEGLEAPRPGSELAKQRLQRILDSGELSMAPVGEASDGATRVHVSVDGNPVSD